MPQRRTSKRGSPRPFHPSSGKRRPPRPVETLDNRRRELHRRRDATDSGRAREIRHGQNDTGLVVGRKGWLFVGSDAHGESAGHIFSLIASARLHRLDPEVYLPDLFRVLAHWPRDRYLELAPKYWAATRARLDAGELAAEIGPLTIPPPLAAPSEDQPPPN